MQELTITSLGSKERSFVMTKDSVGIVFEFRETTPQGEDFNKFATLVPYDLLPPLHKKLAAGRDLFDNRDLVLTEAMPYALRCSCGEWPIEQQWAFALSLDGIPRTRMLTLLSHKDTDRVLAFLAGNHDAAMSALARRPQPCFGL